MLEKALEAIKNDNIDIIISEVIDRTANPSIFTLDKKHTFSSSMNFHFDAPTSIAKKTRTFAGTLRVYAYSMPEITGDDSFIANELSKEEPTMTEDKAEELSKEEPAMTEDRRSCLWEWTGGKFFR